MKNVIKFLSEITSSEQTIYRGHANKNWDLKPSIGRHYDGDWDDVIDVEVAALEDFKKKSVPYLTYKPTTDIEWLSLMQHHGCATRLLDFTNSPLIALFFASDPTSKSDGEVLISPYSVTATPSIDENIFELERSFVYYPPHMTESIIGQSGCFVFSDVPNRDFQTSGMRRIPVPKLTKGFVRNQLRTLGISYSSLFPGLDGICKDLNDILISDMKDKKDIPF